MVSFRVEIVIRREEDLDEQVYVMKNWFKLHKSEPLAFHYTFEPPRIILKIAFEMESEAARFATAFGGKPLFPTPQNELD
jgi:hypothetical protein